MRSAFSERRISRMMALLRRSRFEIGFETANEVFISLVLIFSSYFDCHIVVIITNFLLIHNPYFVV